MWYHAAGSGLDVHPRSSYELPLRYTPPKKAVHANRVDNPMHITLAPIVIQAPGLSEPNPKRRVGLLQTAEEGTEY